MANEKMQEHFRNAFCEQFRNDFKNHISNCEECRDSLQKAFGFLLSEVPLLKFFLKKIGLTIEEWLPNGKNKAPL